MVHPCCCCSRWSAWLILFGLVGWEPVAAVARDYRLQGRRLAPERARLTVLFARCSRWCRSAWSILLMRFLSSGIDSWFDLQVEQRDGGRLTLSKLSLDLHKRESA